MIQTIHPSNDLEEVKLIFDSFIKSFGVPESLLKIDDKEWDLKVLYYPNHAAIWNKPELIGSPCRIVCKDNKFALVQFRDTKLQSSDNVYRLEDLSQN